MLGYTIVDKLSTADKYFRRNLLKRYNPERDDVDYFNALDRDFSAFLGLALEDIIESICFSTNIEENNLLNIDGTRAVVRDYLQTRAGGDRRVATEQGDKTRRIVEGALKAYFLMNDILHSDGIKHLSLDTIKQVNMLFTEWNEDRLKRDNSSLWRSANVEAGSLENPTVFMTADLVEDAMKKWYGEFTDFINTVTDRDKYDKISNFDIVKRAARLKVDFINIHPFPDGNGRVSRWIFQYMMKVAGLGLTVFRTWDITRYHKAMRLGTMTGESFVIETMFIEERLEIARPNSYRVKNGYYLE